MKQLPFFKFDAESWLTGKIQVLPVDEIGIFINLAARIWKAGGSLKNDRFLPRLLGASREQFDAAMQDFWELDIITETEEGELRIKFMDAQLEERAAFIERCAAGGRKGKKATQEQPTSDLQGTLTNPGGTPEHPASNKKEERREEKAESRKESVIPAPAQYADAAAIIGEELAGDFRRWLTVWRDTHGGGRDMPVFRQEAQLRMLNDLPADIRKEAIERAIRGGWRALHDIREPRQGERSTAARTRETGVLTEAPRYGRTERGANSDEWE